MDVEQELADHLEAAEDHLIKAIKLFDRKNKPDRPPGFLERLTRSQEMVTLLYREELIRIRGPLKAVAKAKRKKK